MGFKTPRSHNSLKIEPEFETSSVQLRFTSLTSYLFLVKLDGRTFQNLNNDLVKVMMEVEGSEEIKFIRGQKGHAKGGRKLVQQQNRMSTYILYMYFSTLICMCVCISVCTYMHYVCITNACKYICLYILFKIFYIIYVFFYLARLLHSYTYIYCQYS